MKNDYVRGVLTPTLVDTVAMAMAMAVVAMVMAVMVRAAEELATSKVHSVQRKTIY